MIVTLDEEAADRLRDCVTAGGVAVFPSDTVYGVCCDPDNEEAARRLYALKGRPSARACAVMFFALEDALELLDDLHESEREALQALLPGPVTVLLANRGQRFASACRVDPSTLGLRVPALLGDLEALSTVGVPVLQSSANLSGEPDARTLDQVPEAAARRRRSGDRRRRAARDALDRHRPARPRRGAALVRAPRGSVPRENVEHALAAVV